ncbi:MAG: hypothetical protein ACHP8B_15875, partial [Terriglobales bacterium]
MIDLIGLLKNYWGNRTLKIVTATATERDEVKLPRLPETSQAPTHEFGQRDWKNKGRKPHLWQNRPTVGHPEM